jgi:hypothetical protein
MLLVSVMMLVFALASITNKETTEKYYCIYSDKYPDVYTNPYYRFNFYLMLIISAVLLIGAILFITLRLADKGISNLFYLITAIMNCLYNMIAFILYSKYFFKDNTLFNKNNDSTFILFFVFYMNIIISVFMLNLV